MEEVCLVAMAKSYATLLLAEAVWDGSVAGLIEYAPRELRRSRMS